MYDDKIEKIFLVKDLKNTQLPKEILSGSVSVPAPNSHFRRIPKEWILYIITEGTMKIKEDDKIYTLTAGDAFFLSPGRCHSGIRVNDSISYSYVHFQWEGLHETLLSEKDLLSLIKKSQEEKLSFLPDQNDFDYLVLPKHTTLLPHYFSDIKQIMNKLLSKNDSLLAWHSHIKNALLHLLLLLISRSEEQKRTQELDIVPFVPKLLTYLVQHTGEKISSSTLEKEFHMNFDHMNRKFKESTGKTIFRYLQEYRISEAKKLLKTSQLNVSEIAESLGYCNAFYFSKVFKSIEQISPGEYRKKYR